MSPQQTAVTTGPSVRCISNHACVSTLLPQCAQSRTANTGNYCEQRSAAARTSAQLLRFRAVACRLPEPAQLPAAIVAFVMIKICHAGLWWHNRYTVACTHLGNVPSAHEIHRRRTRCKHANNVTPSSKTSTPTMSTTTYTVYESVRVIYRLETYMQHHNSTASYAAQKFNSAKCSCSNHRSNNSRQLQQSPPTMCTLTP